MPDSSAVQQIDPLKLICVQVQLMQIKQSPPPPRLQLTRAEAKNHA